VELEEGLEQQATTGGPIQAQEAAKYTASEKSSAPPEGTSKPQQTVQDQALLDRKKALEQQLKELEAQLNAQPGNVHHDD